MGQTRMHHLPEQCAGLVVEAHHHTPVVPKRKVTRHGVVCAYKHFPLMNDCRPTGVPNSLPPHETDSDLFFSRSAGRGGEAKNCTDKEGDAKLPRNRRAPPAYPAQKWRIPRLVFSHSGAAHVAVPPRLHRLQVSQPQHERATKNVSATRLPWASSGEHRMMVAVIVPPRRRDRALASRCRKLDRSRARFPARSHLSSRAVPGWPGAWPG